MKIRFATSHVKTLKIILELFTGTYRWLIVEKF